MKSTSFHVMNADKGLLFIEKPLYLLANWVNNLLPYKDVDPHITFKKFTPNIEAEWSKGYPDSSAARRLCDMFWRTLPWNHLEKELGGAVHVFDTGCGHGNYSLRLWDGIKSYTGVDAKRRPNWDILEKEHHNFHFIESNSTNISTLIPPETNFFMSQSAIEHFDEDLRFFEQLKSFIDKRGKPAMQVHLFPAKATLPLYLFHGLRQYTPRTISKITRLFPDAEIILTPLGGKACARLHGKYFTWPVLITRKFSKPTFNVAEYDRALRQAVRQDLESDIRSPLFWALTIKHK